MTELRSDLGRVRGLGSAKEGVGHWWAQRITAIALAPLSIWFVFAVVSLLGADLNTYEHWIGVFGNMLLMLMTIFVLFYHAHLGMQIVIEDYVHTEYMRVIALIIVKLVLASLAASCVLAVVLAALRS